MFMESIKAGVISGILGALLSWLINYFLIDVPGTVFLHAVGNGISGLFSGFFGGFFSILFFIKLHKNHTMGH